MFDEIFPILTTNDLPAALRFYRDLLGGTVTYQFPAEGSLIRGTEPSGLSPEFVLPGHGEVEWASHFGRTVGAVYGDNVVIFTTLQFGYEVLTGTCAVLLWRLSVSAVQLR